MLPTVLLVPALNVTFAINANFAQSPLFLKACMLAGVPPTKRQASAFRNRKGLAFKFANAARKELGTQKVTFIRCGVCGLHAPLSVVEQPCSHCKNRQWKKLTAIGGRVIA